MTIAISLRERKFGPFIKGDSSVERDNRGKTLRTSNREKHRPINGMRVRDFKDS